MSEMTFQEAVDKMYEIIDRDTITKKDYNEFMGIPISKTYTKKEQDIMRTLREGMMIRSQEISPNFSL